MVVLDTNVISELFRPSPSAQVLDWFHAEPKHLLYTTTVTMAEVFAGLEIMPTGRRRATLTRLANHVFERDFDGRILDFTEDAARAYAGIMARAQGRPMSSMDAMIASITLSRRAALATRNTRDFEGCGVRLVNPFGG
jgi:hypothetical protein